MFDPADPDIPEIKRLRAEGASIREIVRQLQAQGRGRGELFISEVIKSMAVSEKGASFSDKKRDIAPRLPDPAPEAGGPKLPEPCHAEYKAVEVNEPGVWGVISDIHIPYHDKRTIEKFVEECQEKRVSGILLNGDILDCYQLSDFLREPGAPQMKEEILKGREFLAWLRGKFPKARIIYKEGNHDDRLKRYLARRAPEIYELEDIWLPNLLRINDLGAEWVGDKRVIMLGKLPVIHGHEYSGGGGVMPARWFYLRTGGSVLGGHFHQPSYYPFRTIRDEEVGCWSTGCACFLSPAYRPLNQWAHGWAMVEIHQGGGYRVHPRRLLKSGQVA